MGAGLVKAAYDLGHAKNIPHAPMRLFAFMAVTALDDAKHPAFFGGAKRLAYAMNVNDGSTVRTALRSLKSAGVIEVHRLGHRGGRNTEYRLLDGNGAALRPLSEKAGSHTPPIEPKAGSYTPKGGETHPEKAGSYAPPQEKEETTKEEARPMPESTAEPARTCRRHPLGWNHADKCAPCMRDRQAHEQWRTALDAQWQAELASQPRRLGSLNALERAKVDQFIRGYGDLPPELMSAAEEARRERERGYAA